MRTKEINHPKNGQSSRRSIIPHDNCARAQSSSLCKSVVRPVHSEHAGLPAQLPTHPHGGTKVAEGLPAEATSEGWATASETASEATTSEGRATAAKASAATEAASRTKAARAKATAAKGRSAKLGSLSTRSWCSTELGNAAPERTRACATTHLSIRGSKATRPHEATSTQPALTAVVTE